MMKFCDDWRRACPCAISMLLGLVGILSGIMDNHYVYGFFENKIDALHWCAPPNRSPTVLSAMSEGRRCTQDTGALYWAVLNEATSDGFAI
jgi:hypothetical protein